MSKDNATENLRAELKSLADTLEEVLSSSGDKSKEEMSKIRSKAEHALRESRHRLSETSDVIADAIGNKYQIRYDRMFDRVFDNSKMLELCGKDFAFLSMEIGLQKCLEKFLASPRHLL